MPDPSPISLPACCTPSKSRILVLLLLSLLGEHGGVGVQAKHDLLVLEGVLLLDSRSSGDGLALGSVEGALDFGAVDQAGEVGLGDNVGGEEEVTLVGGGLGGGAVDLVEGLEGGRGPDDESAEVTTRGELEEVEGGDGGGLDTGDVAESGDELLAVGLGIVDDERATSLAVATATELALASSELLGLLDLLDIGTSTDSLQEAESGRGLGDSGTLEEGGVDNQGNLRDGADLVATGLEQGNGSRGSQGGADSISPSSDVSFAPSTIFSLRKTHFWPWLTLMCHFRQILVGANMRPERHMLPKAA
jgi:hypothetical protein